MTAHQADSGGFAAWLKPCLRQKGAPLQVSKAWGNNGRAPVRLPRRRKRTHQGRSGAASNPQLFLSVLLMDGVFDRHPGLRGAAVELGAGWVPEMCRRLDWVSRIYGRSTSLFDRSARRHNN